MPNKGGVGGVGAANVFDDITTRSTELGCVPHVRMSPCPNVPAPLCPRCQTIVSSSKGVRGVSNVQVIRKPMFR